MAADITVQGNLGQDPEVKFTPSGKQVTELRIAATASHKDQNGQWVDDGDPLWVTASFWGEQHGYLADTLKMGRQRRPAPHQPRGQVPPLPRYHPPQEH